MPKSLILSLRKPSVGPQESSRWEVMARCVACGKEIDFIGILVDGKMRHSWCYEEPEIRRVIDAAITEVKSDEHI